MTAAALSDRRGSAVGAARTVVFVESDDEQAVASRLKVAAGEKRCDDSFQPAVESGRGRVVPVIGAVRGEPGEIRERIIGQVRGELAETNKVGLVDVCKVLERVVAHVVGPAIQGPAAVTRLDVVFPGLARLLHLHGNVVGGAGQARRRLAVVIGKDLSRREDLVVADRRMGIGRIFGGEPVLIGEEVKYGMLLLL